MVYDGWKSYFKQPGVMHALCNAHHLRELRSLKDLEKEPWAKQMYRLLKLGNQIKHSYLDGVVSPKKSEKFKRCFCKILERGITYHEAMKPLDKSTRGRSPRRVGHNLLLRLINHGNAVLLFLANPLIPFTNNQAEQDLRMMKGKQKVSGGFRTANGATTFCRNRSFLSTMRKKGENIINSIADVFSHRKTIWNFT